MDLTRAVAASAVIVALLACKTKKEDPLPEPITTTSPSSNSPVTIAPVGGDTATPLTVLDAGPSPTTTATTATKPDAGTTTTTPKDAGTTAPKDGGVLTVVSSPCLDLCTNGLTACNTLGNAKDWCTARNQECRAACGVLK